MEQISDNKLPFIILIDDSEPDLYINSRVIKSKWAGSTTQQFSMGKEAINYLKANTDIAENIPDIILLDLNMPMMNGFEFLEEYANLSEQVKTKCKIYVLSSSFDPDDIKRASENPYVKSFVEKPINAEKINKIKLDFLS